MRDTLRHFVAEFVGTFALVFVGGAAIMQARAVGPGMGLLGVALAHGLILALLVSATMRVSGHLNPAVTLAFLATRRIAVSMAGLYLVAQLVAAVAAAFALRGLFPRELVEATGAGGQSVSDAITFGQAVALEAIATFFLVFVVFGTAVDPQAPRVGGFAIGLTVAADILAIGPLTGASMNPARSFGPAVATGEFVAQGVYWIGPILGGVLAAVLYDRVFLPRAPEPVAHGAVDPGGPAPRVHGT
jgi:MIP family channel proteins